MLNEKSILITGGTGSFGHAFVPLTLAKYNPRRLVIFSRDEMKQWEMARLYQDDPRVRFFIGDVRDKDRVDPADRLGPDRLKGPGPGARVEEKGRAPLLRGDDICVDDADSVDHAQRP